MKSHRAGLVAGMLVVSAILVALLVHHRSERADTAIAADLERGAEHERDTAPVETLAPPVAPMRDVAATDPTPVESTTVTSEVVASVPDEALELHGHVVVLDPDGRVLPPQDGGFQFTVWRGNTGRSVDVAVQAGEWRAKFDEAGEIESLSVHDPKFGELSLTLVQPEGHFPIPASHELEIRFLLPRSLQLRVLDAETGLDLDDVELVETTGFPMEGAAHPGAEYGSRSLGRNLRSPVALDEFRAKLTRTRGGRVLVGSPGFAWTLAIVDLEHGGDSVVSLSRGGELELSIHGADAKVKGVLRLRSGTSASPICEERLNHDGTISFLGLVPGAYTARAELGQWFKAPVVLGGIDVEVKPGARTQGELVVSPPAVADRVDIGGILYVPTEWLAKQPMIVMNQLATPLDGSDPHATLGGQSIENTRPGFDAYRWQRRRVEVGKYEFGLYAPPFSVVIDVPPGGRDDFELVIAPPCELRVLVVDDASGADVATAKLFWNPRRPDGVTGGSLEPAKREEAQQCYVVRAPAAAIDLQIWDWEYQPYNGVVDLSQGIREHTVRLRRSCGVDLKLVDGETAVAFPSDWYGSLTTVKGSGKEALSQPGEFQRKFMVTEPGTYSIEIPKLPSYRAVPLQTIEVFAGRFTEHVVKLEREHL